MEFFTKIVKNYNYFSKALRLRSLMGFWTCLYLKKFPLHIQNRVYYWKFRQTYSGVFTSYSDLSSHVVAYLEPCVTLAHSEPCHIQNSGKFRTQDIFRTLSKLILVYLERCVTLAYWKPYHTQSFAIFRSLTYLGPEAYSQSCLFRHIQAYSDIFNNDSYNNINFLFFHFNLTFQRNLQNAFWLQWRQFQCLAEST